MLHKVVAVDPFFGREIEQTVAPRDVEALTDGVARLRARGKQGIRTAEDRC